MDRIRKTRGPYRSAITKMCNEIDAELDKEEINADTIQLLLEKLKDGQVSLRYHDSKMMEAMLDADATEDALQEEFDGASEYQDKIRIYRRKIMKVCERSSTHEGEGETDVFAPRQRKFKLPKIELQKFNGNLKQWLGWWSQFKKIHTDADLHDSDKFHYLLQATEEGSEPREILNAYPPTSENYQEAVTALQERYGRETLQLQLYIRELLQLVIINATVKEKPPVQSLYIKLDSNLRALKSMNLSEQSPATYFYPLVESCLNEELLRTWRRKSGGVETDSGERANDLDSLMEFLKTEVQNEQQINLAKNGFNMMMPKKGNEEATRTEKLKNQRKRNFGQMKEAVATASGLMNTKTETCIFCDKSHASKDCAASQKLTLDEKKNKVKVKGACFHCLRVGHQSKNCKSFVKCIVCTKRHQTQMCPEVSKRQEAEPPTTAANANLSCRKDVLLKSVLVRVKGEKGCMTARLVSDEGSQTSHVGSKVVLKTGAKKLGHEVSRNVLFGGKVTPASKENIREVEIQSLDGKVTKRWKLRERQIICPGIPRIPIGPWVTLLLKKNITLSDLDMNPVDSPEVEILIGQDLWNQLITDKRLKITEDLAAVKTIFGWCLCGPLPASENIASVQLINGSRRLEDLWSLETLGIRDPITVKSDEEKNAEAYLHFQKSVKRNKEGRYVVKLPWLIDNPNLTKSNNIAKKRLQSMTKKLHQNGRYQDYDSVIQDWLALGLIEVSSSSKFHLIPHHPVFKPKSLTTPVRPVFDASFTVAGQPSLNSCLHKGPNLLEQIPTILHRFRQRKFGVTNDIKKAFQMIAVDPMDRDFQSFLWWKDNTCKEVVVYQHTRVVFGITASPFLLAATLEYHLTNVGQEDKEVADLLRKSFYVDNCVFSVDKESQYETIKDKASKIMEDAKMVLTQWEHSQFHGNQKDIDETTVLGIKWDKSRDVLFCDLGDITFPESCTKRSVLSYLHKIFDPLGFVSPATLPIKICLQSTWKRKLKWDMEMNEEEKETVMRWISEVKYLSKVKIPRQMILTKEVEIHAFSDASQHAYAAVVFIRSVNNEVILAQAKSRVAPLKQSSIPRLELLGCLLASRLANSVKRALKIESMRMKFWTDSSTCISWIKNDNNRNVFISNRIKEIRKTTNAGDWRFVPGTMNPADLPSRGCFPKEFLNSRWWEGPKWLKDKANWPTSQPEVIDGDDERTEIHMLQNRLQPWIPTKFSSFSSNIRTLAWILRFNQNCRKSEHSGPLKKEEIDAAEKIVVKAIQTECLNKDVKKGCNLKLMEVDGIKCVATKLLERPDSKNFRLPFLLPPNHPLVPKLIMELHLDSHHAGTQTVLSRSREKYWLLRGRRTVRKIINQCVICRRYSSKPMKVESASLPVYRVFGTKIFETTGVDLAGPLFLKNGEKTWIVVYTCAVYRALHLDLVSSLSTRDFMMSMQRFVSQYGRPTTVCSDQGTNFVGMSKTLDRLDFSQLKREFKIEKIKWIFNPPAAPWWGGWWERLIRSIKSLLKRMLGKSRLNFDELRTCISVIMATINDRPLTAVTEDPDDLVPLTPAMFLHPERVADLVEVHNAGDLQQNYKRMASIQTSLQQRFRKEYLALLVQHRQERPTNPKVGDVVLVGAENKRRFEWPLGKIEDLIPGKDGHVRVAKVKTSFGIMTRPLQKLYSLEVQSTQLPPVTIPTSIEAHPIPKDDNAAITRFGRRVKKPSRYNSWF